VGSSEQEHHTRIAIDHAESTQVSVNVVIDDKAKFFRVFNAVIDHLIFAELSNRAARTYIGLARHASSEWKCFPSTRRLAVLAGISTRGVFRGLSELEGKGLLQRISGRGKGSSRYQLLPPPATANTPQLSPKQRASLSHSNVSAGAANMPGLSHRTNKQEQTHSEQQQDNSAVVSSILQGQEGYPPELADLLASTISLKQLRGCQLLSDKSKPRNRGGFLRRCLEGKWDTGHLVDLEEAEQNQRDLFEEKKTEDKKAEAALKAEQLRQEQILSSFKLAAIEAAEQRVRLQLPHGQARLVAHKCVDTSRSLRQLVCEELSKHGPDYPQDKENEPS
jgi:hypothetical protein